MLEQYRTVYEGGEGEITEKNHASSRQFIQWKVKKKRWLFWKR